MNTANLVAKPRVVVFFFALSVLPTYAAGQSIAVERAASTDRQAMAEDATERLQQLIDDSSGVVVLPEGVSEISKPLRWNLSETKCREIRGSAATELVMKGAGPAIRIRGTHQKSAAPAGVDQRVWRQERMPVIAGFGIRGAHDQSHGIEADGTFQLTLSRMHIRKTHHGMHLIGNNRNLLVDGCHIYELGGVGVFYDNVNLHQSNIVGSHISYCDGGGVVARKGNVRNIHISGCDIEGNMAGGGPETANILIDCRDSQFGTGEVAITGCTIQHTDDGPSSANIRILGKTQSREGTPQKEGNVTIVGNVLSDVQHNIHLQNCRGATISANTFWMGFETNLLLQGCEHIVLTGNNMDRNPRYAYGNTADAKNLVRLVDCDACTITGLNISAIDDGPALDFESCSRLNVSAVTVTDSKWAIRMAKVKNSVFASTILSPVEGIAPRVDMQECEDCRVDW